MAFLNMAQEVLMCDRCNKCPVKKYCNKCNASLCDGCVAKHVSSDKKSHDIVIYELKNEDPKFPDCETHAKQQCEMQCKECDIPVCIKCIISGTHHNHHFTDMLEIFNSEKDKILQDTTELETSIYPTIQEAISELQTKLDELPKDHQELMTSISKQGVQWHHVIDVIINKRKEEAEKMKNENESALQKLLSDMENLLSAVHQAVLDNKELLKSKQLKEMKTYKSKNPEFKKSPTKFDVTPPAFTPGPIPKKLDEMFGNLKFSSVFPHAPTEMTEATTCPSKLQLIDSRIVGSDINTGCQRLYDIAWYSHNDIWVSGNNKVMKRFNNRGLLLQTVSTTTGEYPGGITVTPQGELVYTDQGDRSIYIIRNGKTEKLIGIKDWIPSKVCYAASGDLLVSMYKDQKTHKKVVRYRGSKKIEVIQFDQDGKPWFSTGYFFLLFINENRNGDLCASDYVAGHVVVINRSGKLRFRYTGNLSSDKYKFRPNGIVTDSEGHILIADYDHHIIHIISEDGHFIRYIDNCHLSVPYDLSLDKKNTLYVTEQTTAKVRVIEYMK